MNINISEIFVSIDGEQNPNGLGNWSVFIRFQGCGESCELCGTGYTTNHNPGSKILIERIIEEVRKYKINKITITGGEPFEQEEELCSLLSALEKWGYRNITVETNGYHSYKKFKKQFPWVSLVIDFKVSRPPRYVNFIGLTNKDSVKFLITSQEELERVRYCTAMLLALGSLQFYVGVVYEKNSSISSKDVVKYLKKEELFYIKPNFQLHKLLNLK